MKAKFNNCFIIQSKKKTVAGYELKHLNEQGYNSMTTTGISSDVRYLLLSLRLLWSEDLY